MPLTVHASSPAQANVFAAVAEERKFQDQKWGTITEHPHDVGAWLTIMRSLLTDAERAYMSQRGDLGALDEIRKVVAVGAACMEQHGPVFRTPSQPATDSTAWAEAGSTLAG